MNVFFSVGSPSHEGQKQFSDRVREFLAREGLTPLTPGQNYALNMQPLKAVEHCMKSCSGVVVLAFERIHITRGSERRGGDQPKKVDGQNLPTVWNQVEGAMGYTRGLPLLVLAENGLRVDALLENKYDWNVQWIDLVPGALTTAEFRGVFDDWKKQVAAFDSTRTAVPAPTRDASTSRGPIDLAEMSVGEILTGLKGGNAWKLGTGAFLLASLIASTAYGLGRARVPSSASSDSVMAVPALLLDSIPEQVLNKRVSIVASEISDSARRATLHLRMPDGAQTFSGMKQGEQRAFVFEGKEYRLHLLDVAGGDAGPGAVQVKVVRGS